MSGEKTEQPTPKKIKDARKKGQVFKSNELTQSFLFLTAAGILVVAGSGLFTEMKVLMTEFLQPAMLTGSMPQGEMLTRFGNAFVRLLVLTAPLMGSLFLVAGTVTFLQVQALFAPEALKPTMDRINPLKNIQNMFFKAKTYIDLLKNLVKFAIVTAVVFFTLRSFLRDIALSGRMDVAQAAALAGQMLSTLLLRLGGLFIILGAADFFIQRKQYMKDMMMSKYEVQREYKEDEGDPMMKHMRTQLHEEILGDDMLDNVALADVIVVNPTHIAVAVRYDEKTMNAPRVTAKGQVLMAQKIIEVAKKNRIPVIRNVNLAWGLYALNLGVEIPEDLYDSVAEVLSLVYQLTHNEQ